MNVPTTEPPEFISVRPIGCVQLLSPSKPVRSPHPNTHTLENSAVTVRIHKDSHILPFRSTPPTRPTGDGARKTQLSTRKGNRQNGSSLASADNAKNITKIFKTELRRSNQRERQASTGETRRRGSATLGQSGS